MFPEIEIDSFIEELKTQVTEGNTEVLGEKLAPLLSEAKSYHEEISRIRKNRDAALDEKKKLQQKYNSLVDQLRGKSIDPDNIQEFQPITAEATKKQIDAIVANERLAYESKYKELESKLGQVETEATQAKNKLTQYEIKQIFTKAAIDAGVNPVFADDFLTVLQSKGHNISLDPEKGTVNGYRDPSDPVPFSLEMLLSTQLKAKYPQYYKSQLVGGSGGINSGGLNGGRNPWAAETFNLTEQARIRNTNPELAEQLRKAAGK